MLCTFVTNKRGFECFVAFIKYKQAQTNKPTNKERCTNCVHFGVFTSSAQTHLQTLSHPECVCFRAFMMHANMFFKTSSFQKIRCDWVTMWPFLNALQHSCWIPSMLLYSNNGHMLCNETSLEKFGQANRVDAFDLSFWKRAPYLKAMASNLKAMASNLHRATICTNHGLHQTMVNYSKPRFTPHTVTRNPGEHQPAFTPNHGLHRGDQRPLV